MDVSETVGSPASEGPGLSHKDLVSAIVAAKSLLGPWSFSRAVEDDF